MTLMLDEEVAADPRELITNVNDFYTVYHEDVARISRKVANEFKTVQAEDLEQDLWADLSATWEKILEASKFTVQSIIRRRALQLANKERIDYMHFSGSYLYTPKDVRLILSESAWSDIDQAPDIEGRVDVRAKFDKLAPGRQAAVYKRYGLGVTYKELSKSEQNALERGVGQITDWLNSALNFYSVSYENSMQEDFGGSDTAKREVDKSRRANQATNFLNGKA